MAALLCAAVIAAECTHWEALEKIGFATMPRSLPPPHKLLLLFTRYFCFRWTCNAGLYLAAGCNLKAIEKKEVSAQLG